MKTWKYDDYSQTVRQMPENYCLFSAKTFGDGGTYDAAALPEAVENLRLAAAAPRLLASLMELTEWMRSHTGLSDGVAGMLIEAVSVIKGVTGELPLIKEATK